MQVVETWPDCKEKKVLAQTKVSLSDATPISSAAFSLFPLILPPCPCHTHTLFFHNTLFLNWNADNIAAFSQTCEEHPGSVVEELTELFKISF